jgi:hypothetical protein
LILGRAPALARSAVRSPAALRKAYRSAGQYRLSPSLATTFSINWHLAARAALRPLRVAQCYCPRPSERPIGRRGSTVSARPWPPPFHSSHLSWFWAALAPLRLGVPESRAALRKAGVGSRILLLAASPAAVAAFPLAYNKPCPSPGG